MQQNQFDHRPNEPASPEGGSGPEVYGSGVHTSVVATGAKDRIIRWLFEKGRREYWKLYLSLFAATVILFFWSKPPAESPLISSYLDLLDERSHYAIPEIVAAGGLSFYLSLLFIIVLTLFLYATLRFCWGSRLEYPDKAGGVVIRRFGLANDRTSKLTHYLVLGLYALMLIANVGLFYFYAEQLENPDVTQTGWLFRTTYFAAITSRLIGVLLGLGALLQLMLEDFKEPIRDFIRSYRTYFYPPLISLAIVAFVFTRMDQFDSLFIDLVTSPGNFLLFSLLLFPASIIIIWFTPSYLLFTDRQFANRVDSWDILERLNDKDPRYKNSPKLFAWTVLHKRLFPQLDQLPENGPPPQFMPKATRRIGYPTNAFNRFRAFLATLYILTLVSICAKIYFGNLRDPWISPGLFTALTFLCALFYVICTLWISEAAHRENIRVERKYPSPENVAKLRWYNALLERPRAKRSQTKGLYVKAGDSVVFVRNNRPFTFGLTITLLALMLFIVTLIRMWPTENTWEQSFPWFLGFLACSVFAFAWLALFQSYFHDHTFNNGKDNTNTPSDKFLDRVDHMTTQVMLIFNPVIAGLALVFFFVGLFNESVVSAEWVAWLNPLNIYLLLVNGAIAGLILIDRYLLLRDRRKQYRAVKEQSRRNVARAGISTANLFWGMAIIGTLLAINYLGNSYHEIQYHDYNTVLEEAPDIDEYTARFVADTNQTGPVIFVASDGGGLKACYWTMLNLLELDKKGLYSNNVFALSGASGGTIGISMYNYLKARNKTPEEIRTYIERLGSRNYLSGDFAGLLTRFPINYWPDLPGLEPHLWDDRMEGMARAYFRIVGDGDGHNEYSFEQSRELPFWRAWKESRNLPLLIINTARAEDGLLGTVVPLRENPLVGTIDLTRNGVGKAISYPDATFLSNRFPLASPAGRITGKGHFVDAGNADNSGIGSLYTLLRTLKANEIAERNRGEEGPYTQLFNRKIIVLSLRNAVSRYVRDEFLGPVDSLMNRYPYKSEVSSVLGAAVNTGLTGVPVNWDDYLRGPIARQLGLVDTFMTINLPFRLRPGDIYANLGGELKLPGLANHRDSLNQALYDHLGPDYGIAVMPPLGRLLAEPTRRYMDRMVSFPAVRKVHEEIK